jgi:signal transduction histidine kinase
MLAGGREHSVLHTLDLKSALALASALERAPMGLLMLHDHLSGHLYPALAHGMTSQQCSEFGIHRPGIGPIGRAFSEGRPLELDCTPDLDGALRTSMNSLRSPRLSVVPLSTDGAEGLGLLVLFHRRRRQTTARPLLQLYASVLATALENVHLREIAEDARERTEARSKAKTLFFARISHELRTPLQSVIGYLDLMRLEAPDHLPDRHLELMGRAVKSGEAMLGVIDDLINFSRVEVGRIKYDLRRVSVADAMTAAEIVIAPIAASRHVELHVEPPAKEFVRADASKMQQILINLLANAVKFTPSGGSVHLRASRDGRAGEWINMSVTDTGRGIPSDKLGMIFEPFVQLGIPTLDGLGGSGLGLPISREFAAAMGGEIEASSNGHGSTFTLRLHRDRLSRHRRPKTIEVTPPSVQNSG